jgi:hypothetical protein
MNTTTTGVTALAEELLPAVPRPAPRPRKRPHRHPATGLLAVGLVAVTIVMAGAVLTLRADVVQLQHQLQIGRPVSCADLTGIRLHLRSRTVRCTGRGADMTAQAPRARHCSPLATAWWVRPAEMVAATTVTAAVVGWATLAGDAARHAPAVHAEAASSVGAIPGSRRKRHHISSPVAFDCAAYSASADCR